MRIALFALFAAFALVAPTGCGIIVDDGPYWEDFGPPDGDSDGGADAEVDAEVDAYWPYLHAPEDCPEEARRRQNVCDPRCDGVSHFYCTEQPSDPCCRCRQLGGGGEGGSGGAGGGGGDGRNPGSSGSGGGLPPDPRF